MMRDKKGIIFIETIIVLVVLAVSLVGLYTMFSYVMLNSARRKSYDNMNDIYKVNIVHNLITTFPSDTYTIITGSNCSEYMSVDCTEVFSEFYIEQVLITGNNIQTILDLNINIPNTMKEYLETINKNRKSIVVHFIRDEKNYYASLELGEV